jgi:large subunit ribosomal protein L22
MMKVKAQAKWIRIGSRKLARVLEIIRGQKAQDALDLLRFMPQKGARILEKIIKSAVANAKNNYKLDESTLIIAEAYVNKGMVMKRMRPRARGRGFPINKRTCHLTMFLSEKSVPVSKAKAAKQPKEAA